MFLDFRWQYSPTQIANFGITRLFFGNKFGCCVSFALHLSYQNITTMMVAVKYEDGVITLNSDGKPEQVPGAIHNLQALSMAGHEILIYTLEIQDGDKREKIKARLESLNINVAQVAFKGYMFVPSQLDLIIDPRTIGQPLNGDVIDWETTGQVLRAKGLLELAE